MVRDLTPPQQAKLRQLERTADVRVVGWADDLDGPVVRRASGTVQVVLLDGRLRRVAADYDPRFR